LPAGDGALIVCSSDVVFFNAALRRLYVAAGDPGRDRGSSVPTEEGAYTLAFDPARHLVAAFLPRTHRAWLYVDQA
jgi:hypothetical protein